MQGCQNCPLATVTNVHRVEICLSFQAIQLKKLKKFKNWKGSYSLCLLVVLKYIFLITPQLLITDLIARSDSSWHTFRPSSRIRSLTIRVWTTEAVITNRTASALRLASDWIGFDTSPHAICRSARSIFRARSTEHKRRVLPLSKQTIVRVLIVTLGGVSNLTRGDSFARDYPTDPYLPLNHLLRFTWWAECSSWATTLHAPWVFVLPVFQTLQI